MPLVFVLSVAVVPPRPISHERPTTRLVEVPLLGFRRHQRHGSTVNVGPRSVTK